MKDRTAKTVKTAISMTMIGWLAGCMSSGTKVTPEQAAQFKPGLTTEQEVIAKLGSPNSSSTLPDGSKYDMYLHIATSMHAANFIPVVGLFASGASNNKDSVTFTFDANGLLKTVSSSSGHQDINTGLLNQK